MAEQKDLLTKRWRKVRAPTPKEYQLQISVAEYVRLVVFRDVAWNHVPNGELREKRTAAKLKAMGVTPGWPDLQFFKYDPLNGIHTLLGLELKRRGGKLSAAQIECAEKLRIAGWFVEDADNFEDAIEVLERHGMVRPQSARKAAE